MSIIIFVRHGESEGNKADTLAGIADVPLTATGYEQARLIGKELRSYTFQSAHTSKLRRAQDTLLEILDEIHQTDIPIARNAALNERDFGAFTGAAKAALQETLGKDRYNTILKGWDTPTPEGESLQDVQRRVLPYFQTKILPEVAEGKNVLVVSHNQTLRALLKYIENIPDKEIESLQLKNAEPIIYEFDRANRTLTRRPL